MAWFNRKDKGIQTPTTAKKEAPDGLWYKTPSGKVVHMRELKNNSYVSPEDDYHVRIGSKEYFEILFDSNEFEEMDDYLEHWRDMDFSYAAVKQLEGKYLVQNRVTGEIYESAQFLYILAHLYQDLFFRNGFE